MTAALPIIIIVTSNVFYNLCTKCMPSEANPFAALIVTYLSAALTAFLMLLLNTQGHGIGQTFQSVNWMSIFLGLSIVWLEFGYIQAFRAGWNISTCSLVANSLLAVILLIVGYFAFREHISGSQIFGIVLCAAGLYFVNKH